MRWLLPCLVALGATAAPARADSVRVAPDQRGLVVPRIGVMYDATLGDRHGVGGIDVGVQLQPWRGPDPSVIFGARLMLSPWGDFSSHHRAGLEVGYSWEMLERGWFLEHIPHWIRFGCAVSVVVDYWDIWYDDDLPQGAGIGGGVMARPTARVGRFELSGTIEAGRIAPIDGWYWSKSMQLGVVF